MRSSCVALSKTERVHDEDREIERANVKMKKILAVVVVSAGMAAMGVISAPLTNGDACRVVTNRTCGDCPRAR